MLGARLMTPYSLARPLLFSLDPERAHDLVLAALARPWLAERIARRRPSAPPDTRLRQYVAGVCFEHPVGLAAGLDKQGSAVGAWAALGFGAAEIGTVTPRAQPGNPRPRLFRLPADEALINRFGFNSDGAARVAENLGTARPPRMRLGINAGKNRDTPNERAVDDYIAVVETLRARADYLVINVSSPNTSGLRDLQESRRLRALVTDVVSCASDGPPPHPPVLVKLSPDMDDSAMLETVDAALAAGAAGIVATNTTLARDGLRTAAPLSAEQGGLSGRPLRTRATRVCRMLFAHIGRRAPIVGVGGIASAEDAYERLRSGAALVQVYTAFVYAGPALVHTIVSGLSALLDRDGFASLEEVIGIDAH